MNNLIVICRGKKYIADNEYFRDYALNLNDTGTALNNPRSEFIVNNFEHFHIIKHNKHKKHRSNTIELLHSLSFEMIHKCNLSSEDEQFLDEIMGNDPMCMF